MQREHPQATSMRRLLAHVLTVLLVLIAPTALAQIGHHRTAGHARGAQVAWLLEVSSRMPMSEAEDAEHFSPEFVAVVRLPR